MSDLLLGLLLMAVLSAGLFCIARRAGRFYSKRATRLLAVTTVGAILCYTRVLWDSPLLATVLPFSNLIVLGNWFPLGSAVLAGLVIDEIPMSRRHLIISALAAMAGFSMFEPLLGTTPECHQCWSDEGDCVQTTDATCSPACAVTLLRMHGIATTEQEMAELCLTRRGTRWQGLYRGLKAKTSGTPWDVEIILCSTDELNDIPGQMILTVGIDQNSLNAEMLRSEAGWQPDVNHSVLRVSVDRNGVSEIIDPSPDYGRELWTNPAMNTLYRGHAIRLVQRNSHHQSGLVSALANVTSSLGIH